jgi:1,4-dihydroxy-2-naphthoate octaprenyltransferase
LANDYGDSVHGADHAGRKGPARTVQAGLISKEKMKSALVFFSILSFVTGCILLYLAAPNIGLLGVSVLLAVGILSIVAAIAYTNGKRPYGYAGLGDVSVFIFFGWVAVLGAQYLQTTSITQEAIFLSIAYGCLSIGVLNLNNMRDIQSDQIAGKKSIPVRIGLPAAKLYHYILLLTAFVCFCLFFFVQEKSFIWNVIIALPIFINLRLVYFAKDYASFDPLLKWLSLSTFIITLIIQISI